MLHLTSCCGLDKLWELVRVGLGKESKDALFWHDWPQEWGSGGDVERKRTLEGNQRGAHHHP
jgi:hypothetical protein